MAKKIVELKGNYLILEIQKNQHKSVSVQEAKVICGDEYFIEVIKHLKYGGWIEKSNQGYQLTPNGYKFNPSIEKFKKFRKPIIWAVLFIVGLVAFLNSGVDLFNKTEKVIKEKNEEVKNDKFDLDKILSGERFGIAISQIDLRLNKISNFGENLDVLNTSQRLVVIIENLEREINNGGFNQFYYNSSGEYANETVHLLKKVGANRTAEIVEEANREWENGFVPKERTKRRQVLERIEIKTDSVWSKCDTEFLEYEDDISGRLIEFVKNNRQDFK